ncbi:MAG: hypothetical protein QHH30_01810, partial [candidate division NC10 bacterium]|nr:hypothetical protein [candidate division NC10 bacterium]
QRLARQNEEYLSASFNKALIGFGVLSVLKAGLDIIEGSEVGASFGVTAQLQVGDIVQPAYDYVDIAWRTLLTSCVTLLSIRYLLKAAQIVDHHVLGGTLTLVACFLGLLWWRRNWTRTRSLLRDLLGVAIVASLALYYLLPLSVWSASKLSQAITQSALEEAQKGFEEAKNILFPEDQQQVGGVVAKLKYMQDRIQHIAGYLKEKTKDMVVWTVQLITGYLFDCIIFPLILFALLLWLVRGIVRYLFEKGLQASLRDDLARILMEARGRST